MEEEIAKREISSSGSEEALVMKDELEKRKKQAIKFFKEKGAWVYSLIFAFILFLGLHVRVLNISKLKDVTTGTWTLGPDLDPFLFLRWAQYIAVHGKLFILDPFRNVPLINICTGSVCDSINTSGEMKMIPYLIAWLYKFLSIFSKNVTVNYAAIIYPVVMFGFSIIAFFLFARKVFYKLDKNKRNIIALISTALFAVIPSLLPRTIAGIPEKESGAFGFIFLALYFLIEAVTAEKLKKSLIFGALAGVATGLLGLDWGGVIFVFIAIPITFLFIFLLGKVNKKEFYIYVLWMAFSIITTMPFSSRYTPLNLIMSSSTAIMFLIFFILLVDFLIFKNKLFRIDEKLKKIKIPKEIISIIIAFAFLAILATIIFGPSFIGGNISDIISLTISPGSPNRFSVTVAENKTPYFLNDWINEFGPIILSIPLYFWLFFIGSIFLFNYLIKPLSKKEKILMTLGYTVFLFCLIFSNYSPSSIMNGASGLSIFVYIAGALFFVGTFFYVYYKRHKKSDGSVFKELEFSYILYFIMFTISIIAGRAGVRYIMVLAAVSPLAAGFLIFKVPDNFLKEKDDTKKFFIAIIAIILILAFLLTFWNYYQSDKTNGENYAPGPYQWQWQKAMAWVRENTSVDAVFAHWWDYGYWVQTIGERATILDGGNALGYWDYMMGRFVLTETNSSTSLDFLYAHNATNLLIDSTDIGKYSAFSSIGSDANYDRFSWISTFTMDDKQTQETNNQSFYVYTGGSPNDADITYNINGTDVFLPARTSVVAAIVLGKDSNQNLLQPIAIFQYNGAQYKIPLRYAYVNGNLQDFQSGLDAGVFIFPSASVDSSGKLSVNPSGALFFLSPRTIHTQLVQLYLFNEQSNYFKLVHSEPDPFIDYLKTQGINVGDFLYYQGFKGPIKIWGITYPSGIKLDTDYLKLDYPSLSLENVNPGYSS